MWPKTHSDSVEKIILMLTSMYSLYKCLYSFKSIRYPIFMLNAVRGYAQHAKSMQLYIYAYVLVLINHNQIHRSSAWFPNLDLVAFIIIIIIPVALVMG